MLTVYIDGHDFAYETENIARMFTREVRVVKGAPQDDGGDLLHTVLTDGDIRAEARVGGRESSLRASAPPDKKGRELRLARLCFVILRELYGKKPPWGTVTGIRPAKLAGAMMAGGMTPDECVRHLVDDRLVDEDKAELCVKTELYSSAAAKLSDGRSYSLYVSVPFCPTRCSYCSFVSKTVDRDRSLLDGYVDRLCEELVECGRIVKELGLRLETAYVGGGTPTVLSARQLERLTGCMNRLFGARDCREFSVEAGRPDTIDREKLKVLKDAGVGRISINPQTCSDEVLRLAGRTHTFGDVEKSFSLAREVGFKSINADLIAGLPGDTRSGFRRTLELISSLEPENLTVHALTLKRASSLTENAVQPARDAAGMVSDAYAFLSDRGYIPYYMYKQKGTVDSLENTGYCLKGHECLYNIFIMDELHTIAACGAGAVSKLKSPVGPRIERIFNYKYPAEYISGFDEILKRKRGIAAFYEGEI